MQKRPNGSRRRSFVMWATLFSAALLQVFAMPCRASEAASDTEVDAFLERLSDAVARVHDYGCTFGKQERVDGELQPASTIVLKQRREPRCIYMKWTAGPERGREAIHCPVKYGNDLKVHEGSGIASWMTLTLDPNGSTAMDGERHPITEAGIFFPVEKFVAHVRADRSHLRFERSNETPGCLTVTQATPTEFYAHRTEVCVEPEHSLPASLTVWDARGALLERYTFTDYRIDVGTTDRDFDVANPDYRF